MAGWGSPEVVYEDEFYRIVRKAKAYANESATYVLERPFKNAMNEKFYSEFRQVHEDKEQILGDSWQSQLIIRLLVRMRGLEHQLANPKKDLEDRS